MVFAFNSDPSNGCQCCFLEQRWAIKEISRDLRVSRTTVRKVVRSGRTTFKYAREVQPSPKLGEWMGPLTAIVEAEARLPKRERRSTPRLFEELRGWGAAVAMTARTTAFIGS